MIEQVQYQMRTMTLHVYLNLNITHLISIDVQQTFLTPIHVNLNDEHIPQKVVTLFDVEVRLNLLLFSSRYKIFVFQPAQ